MPGRKHVSFAVEKDNKLYWFDAGEGCSYTAHLMGVDLSLSRAFHQPFPYGPCRRIGNLLWNIRKLDSLNGRMSGKD